MSRRPPRAPKRGRGRPSIDPGGEGVSIRVRIAMTHYETLRRLVEEGHGPTLSDAARWAIEQAT